MGNRLTLKIENSFEKPEQLSVQWPEIARDQVVCLLSWSGVAFVMLLMGNGRFILQSSGGNSQPTTRLWVFLVG